MKPYFQLLKTELFFRSAGDPMTDCIECQNAITTNVLNIDCGM